jgi:endonuclease YncB( thermonuclease family)
MTKGLLRNAKRIEITDVAHGEYLRLLGRLVVDGEDVGSQLLSAGFAVPYNGRAKIKDWC